MADTDHDTTTPAGDGDVAPATPRRRGRRGAVLLALVLVVGVAAAALVWRLRSAEEVPYADPSSTGLLTLCSASGEQVTEGRVGDRPFADVVLGSTPLGAAPNGQVSSAPVATLFAYQPREGVDAREFSGTALTATVAYRDAKRPAASIGKGTWSVGDFTTAFPADFDGYVQLRLLLGSPEGGTVTDRYDTADLRVDGDRWHVVRGGDASCRGAADAVPSP